MIHWNKDMAIYFNFFWIFFLGMWSFLLYTTNQTNTLLNYLYNLGYGALLGYASLNLFLLSRKATNLKLPLQLLSLGSIFFFIANIIWFYYNLKYSTDVPYPSSADFLWLLFYLLTAIGSVIFFVNLKAKVTVSSLFETVIVTAVIFFPLQSFMSINHINTNNPLITTLNLLYPLLDSLLVSIYLTTIRNNFQLVGKELLSFLFCFVFLIVADSLFAYQASKDLYWNGNLTDFIFAFSSFLFVLGVLKLPEVINKSQSI